MKSELSTWKDTTEGEWKTMLNWLESKWSKSQALKLMGIRKKKRFNLDAVVKVLRRRPKTHPNPNTRPLLNKTLKNKM